MIKSIKIRKFLQYLTLVLFPVTLNFFSPYLIIEGAFKGIATASMLLFAALLLGSIFLGRLFCSTVCPVGSAGDILCSVNNKPIKNKKIILMKWIIWIPWIGGILAGVISAGGIKEISPLFMTESGISVDRPQAYIIYFGVLAIVTIINIAIGKRAACHSICWMAPFMIIGIQIRKLTNLPGLSLKAKSEACVHCLKCNEVCPMSLNVEEMVRDDEMTQINCILCGQCVKTCPKSILDFEFKRN